MNVYLGLSQWLKLIKTLLIEINGGDEPLYL